MKQGNPSAPCSLLFLLAAACCAALPASVALGQTAAPGTIETVAGPGSFSGDGGPATAAWMRTCSGVAVDSAGNLYIADTDNHRIRKVDAAGNISTVVGDGTRGYSGDDGPATQAQLFFPSGVAADGAGNLYIANINSRIRKVDATGAISTVAGDGTRGYGGDGGPAALARLSLPNGAAVDGAGNLYIADWNNNRIRKVDAAGNISTAAGDGTRGDEGDGGPAALALLNGPTDVAVDGTGNLYIADSNNRRIRKVDTAGNISTAAGDGTRGDEGDGGPAALARFDTPVSVAVDGTGNLYIADRSNHRIRKVDATGNISTAAGDGTRGYSGDGGPAALAQLSSPGGVAADGAGNLYIADRSNHRIRKVDAAGNISTAAGYRFRNDGDGSNIGDGGPATQALLNGPSGVAADGAGNLYIADRGNHRIRKVTGRRDPSPTPRISSGGIVPATGTPVVNRISPNALVSVYGQEFVAQGTQTANPALDAAGNIATQLAATCLEIDGKRAPLFLVTPQQINAQAPHELTPGRAPVTVVRNCGAQQEQRGAAAVEAATVSPAFFNFVNNADGRNPLAAQHGGGPAPVGAPGLLPGAQFTPAEPGEIVTLYGTGFGATEPPLEAGRIPGAAAHLANPVAFTVGGIAVPAEDVLYAGAAPCCAGLYLAVRRRQ